MTDVPPSDGDTLPAGDVASWLAATQAALAGRRDADVPCDGCTACCTSSQFVHVDPDETDTLAHIPAELLFPAPGLPPGHVLLGYDERGHCPMLVDGRCSIYEHRPRTCRTYDCRVFAAAGVALDDPAKVAIADRVRRWRFRPSDPADGDRLAAVRAAAVFLAEHPEAVPDGRVPDHPKLSVLALMVHELFLSGAGPVDPAAVRAAIDASTSA